MLHPQCVAVDAQDNIYVTDSEAGKIFVFDANGKYQRAIGSLKGGEGFFKRPTGIAVDSAAQKIYVTDTLRDKIFVLDMQGSVLQTIGKLGTGDGEFNYPTELRLKRPGPGGGGRHEFPRTGAGPLRQFPLRHRQAWRRQPGGSSGPRESASTPKAISTLSMALWGMVQVFTSEGQLLYYFGKTATARATSSCLPDCTSTATIAFTLWIPIIAAIQVFHYFGSCASRRGR